MIGLNFASLLGIYHIALGCYFLISGIRLLASPAGRDPSARLLLLLQILLIAPAFWLVGLIVVFQDWRLDPILQFAFFLMTPVIFYLSIKDILVRQQR